jgi:hypothetical protein
MPPARLLAVLAASLLAAPAAAQRADSAVALRFDWKPGTTARVEASQVRVSVVGQKADTVRTTSRYTMRVEPHPEGRLIRFSDHQFSPRPPGVRAMSEALQQITSGAVPAYVVSGGGDFLRVDDIRRARAQMDTLVSTLVGEARDSVPAPLRPMLDSFTSAEVLTSRASQDWSLMVGAWIGGVLEAGRKYSGAGEEPNPLEPGTTIRMRYTFGLKGRVPCREGGVRNGCVALEVLSEPDPATYQAFMRRFVGRLGLPAAELAEVEEQLKGAGIQNSIVLVMDPRTMLPHRLENLRRARLVALGENGGVVPTTHTDLRVYAWTYVN